MLFVGKIWEKASDVKIIGAAKNDQDTFAQKAENITKEAPSVQNVGFIGLGAMGFGMASTLLREKFTVCGFDVRQMIK
jgi:UDP-N-acetyl-D-mannosaminuronate dehydrogenase